MNNSTVGSQNPESLCKSQNQDVVKEEEEDPRAQLSYYGITKTAQDRYRKLGIEKLYDWQVKCLAVEDVLDYGKSLVYTAPTSGGKSLVAEILMMRRLLYQGLLLFGFIIIYN